MLFRVHHLVLTLVLEETSLRLMRPDSHILYLHGFPSLIQFLNALLSRSIDSEVVHRDVGLFIELYLVRLAATKG